MDKLALLEPKELMIKLSDVNTPLKCVQSDNPSLAEIKKEVGPKKLAAIIQMWIADINNFLNISRKMNTEQAQQTSTMILNDFYYMNIADINLVFSRAKKGYYGELYQSIDGMKIYLWFDQYATERAQSTFDDNINEHSKIKEQR